MMLTGFLCMSLYAISFSCCAVLINPVFHDEDEGRYQRDLDNFEVHKPQHYRKTLLDDDSRDLPGTALPGTALPGSHGSEEEDEEEYQEESEDISYNEKEYSDWEKQHGLHFTKIRTKGTSTTNTMAKVDSNGSKKLPEAIIIGVKKGGTRALLEFIRIHPDVRAPGPEPHFFDRHFEKGLEWYRQQMPTTIEGQITMEKTPSYFVTKNVPQHIFNMSKNMKMILVVRDPVTRALSDYAQTASKRDVKPFEQMAFLDNNTGLVDTSWGAIRIGVYAKHLERWLKYFPLEQIHIVDGARLITDPAGEMAKVQSFLGLKHVITEKHFYFNSTKGFPCLKKPEKSDRPHCLGKTKGRPHPKVDPQILQRLRDFYRPFNQKFYQMTRRDFGWT